MIKSEYKETYAGFFPFWDKLSPDDREKLIRSATEVSYAKGQLVHGGSAECTGAIIVTSGMLRAYLLSEDGREITLYRLYPGDVCMLSASCVLRSITFDIFVDSQVESHAIVVDGRTFAEISDHNVYAENFALNVAVNRFSEVMWIMQQILFMSFDRRLAIFLYEEMAKTDSSVIQMTHDQVARYMGSAREVVTRMLKYFVTEGIVTLTRGGITITDKKKLFALTE